MFTYFKMKRNEWKIKNAIYSSIVAVIENQKEITSVVKKLFEAFKGSSVEELRTEFVGKLAEIIHEENKNKNKDKGNKDKNEGDKESE